MAASSGSKFAPRYNFLFETSLKVCHTNLNATVTRARTLDPLSSA